MIIPLIFLVIFPSQVESVFETVEEEKEEESTLTSKYEEQSLFTDA